MSIITTSNKKSTLTNDAKINECECYRRENENYYYHRRRPKVNRSEKKKTVVVVQTKKKTTMEKKGISIFYNYVTEKCNCHCVLKGCCWFFFPSLNCYSLLIIWMKEWDRKIDCMYVFFYARAYIYVIQYYLKSGVRIAITFWIVLYTYYIYSRALYFFFIKFLSFWLLYFIHFRFSLCRWYAVWVHVLFFFFFHFSPCS